MLQRILDALQGLAKDHAHSALTKAPAEGSDAAFAFGHAQGVYLGLQLALAAVNKAAEADEDAHDRGTLRHGGQPYLRT